MSVQQAHGRAQLVCGRRQPETIMDRAVADRATVTVTRRRSENVVNVAQSDLEAMKKALYMLSLPANAKHLMDGIAEVDAGRGEEHELIDP